MTSAIFSHVSKTNYNQNWNWNCFKLILSVLKLMLGKEAGNRLFLWILKFYSLIPQKHNTLHGHIRANTFTWGFYFKFLAYLQLLINRNKSDDIRSLSATIIGTGYTTQIPNHFISVNYIQHQQTYNIVNIVSKTMFRMWTKKKVYPQISNVNNIQFFRSYVFSTPNLCEGEIFNIAHDLLYVTCSLTTFTIASGEKIEFVWCCDIV